MNRRLRLPVALAIALSAIAAWQLLPVAAHGPSTSGSQAVVVAATTNHYLRSGLVSVNNGYIVKFSAANALDATHTITLKLRDADGKVAKSITQAVGPNKSLTLTFDPPAPIRLRAELLVVGVAEIQCNGLLPTLELDTKNSAGTKPVLVIDDFRHLDEPAI